MVDAPVRRYEYGVRRKDNGSVTTVAGGSIFKTAEEVAEFACRENRLGSPATPVEPVRRLVIESPWDVLTTTERDQAFYFGCWGQTGHYLFRPGMRKVRERYGEALPWGSGIDGRFCPTSTMAQSAARLTHDQGWTVLSINDYTVDKRGQSHATFAFRDATLHFEEAIAEARRHFPEVVSRIEAAAPITEAVDG